LEIREGFDPEDLRISDASCAGYVLRHHTWEVKHRLSTAVSPSKGSREQTRGQRTETKRCRTLWGLDVDTACGLLNRRALAHCMVFDSAIGIRQAIAVG
jgi:hypothetical protein